MLIARQLTATSNVVEFLKIECNGLTNTISMWLLSWEFTSGGNTMILFRVSYWREYFLKYANYIG